MIIQGAMDIAWGAASTSPSPALENTILRVLGFCLIATGLLMPLRLKPLYWWGAVLFVLATAEVLAFSPFQNYSKCEILATVAILLLVLMLPAFGLIFIAVRYA
jgi:hypothetical protein